MTTKSNRFLKRFKVVWLYGALILALLSGTARAQDDFFPPEGIIIPCCSSGGTGGHTGATYGENGQSAWKQVWGAAPGDIVTFQFVLRARSAGSLHAWPQTTGGDNMQYLGDPNNQYEKWYWNTGERDSGGTFCIDCPWQFVANSYNPWIYIDYWDSGDGWDVDLNVTNITTPHLVRHRPLVDQFTKEKNQQYANVSGNASQLFNFAGGLFAARGEVAASITLFALGYGSYHLQQHFQKIANDPFDYDYGSPYEAQIHPQMEADLASTCPGVYENDNSANGFWSYYCWDLTQVFLRAEAFTRAIGVTNDRVESCIQVGAGCEGWQRERGVSFFHESGGWLGWLGALYRDVAQNMQNQGINADPYDAIGYLFWYGDVLQDANAVFQGVQ